MRAVGVATLVVAAAVTLSSCSALGGGAAAAESSASASGDVLDPSVPTATPTEPIASDTPLPTATEVATTAPSSSADARTAVVPFITTADWDASAKVLDVSAIVPGITEGDGTCTYSVTSGSTTRTAKTAGVSAGSYTGCPAVDFTDLAAGAWHVSVRYSSTGSVGTSAADKTAQVG